MTTDQQRVAERYPVQVSPYYYGLIDQECLDDDPIAKQCLPDPRELADDDLPEDGLGECDQMPVPRLIHRYNDRAVLLVNSRCPVYCRFCFRKRLWRQGADFPDITGEELNRVCDYLASAPAIKDILISGGDPMMLSNGQLETILTALTAKELSLVTLRLCSRTPATLPTRIDDATVAMLAGFPGLWFVTHFNHPRELTEASIAACRRLVKAGIPMLNQTVLLTDVNDDADTLGKLFRQLAGIGVKPHYLFHLDPVKGVSHFRTGIERGLEIMRDFRKNLSSLATPTFAIDLPDGGGKVALTPDFTCPEGYEGLDGQPRKYD